MENETLKNFITKRMDAWLKIASIAQENANEHARVLALSAKSDIQAKQIRAMFQIVPKVTHFDNTQNQKAKNSAPKYNLSQEEQNLKNSIGNIRLRPDGRLEWRKTIDGVRYNVIEYPRNFKRLTAKIYEIQNAIKDEQRLQTTGKDKPKISHRLCDLAESWVQLNKIGKVADGQYKSAMSMHIVRLTKGIKSYSKNDIHLFLNEIKKPSAALHCWYIIKNTFAEAYDERIIRHNPVVNLKFLKTKPIKGMWFNLDEQALILNNLQHCKISHEIRFYIMTGLRLKEALNCRPEFDRNRIWAERSKRDGSSGYVLLSPAYSAQLAQHWDNMFKLKPDQYARHFVKFIESLGIKRQENEKPIHRLRHTFATNIYYLGADDKLRSHQLGHKKTEITNDIYTDFELYVTKESILALYGNMYPEY